MISRLLLRQSYPSVVLGKTRAMRLRSVPLVSSNAAFVRSLSSTSPKIEALCDDVCKLNVIELAEFLELFKEKAGLKDSDLMGAAPVAVAAPVGAVSTEEAAAPPKEEKEFFDIKLTGYDDKAKIKIIKEIRGLTGLGLKEAKEVVEGVPSVFMKEIKKEEADEIVKKITELGGKIELE
mmetsp:Transcript_23433/g.30425  ORF Transcript_23433/g.30425 Transcript_23433/m.30425 type:complete len:179 (-) Transcript_23433:280-816(-)